MLHIALCEDDAAELSLLSSMLEHYEKLHPRTIEYDGILRQYLYWLHWTGHQKPTIYSCSIS